MERGSKRDRRWCYDSAVGVHELHWMGLKSSCTYEKEE